MKRLLMIFSTSIILSLLLCGCAARQPVPEDLTVDIEGKQATISQQSDTITTGTDVYRFAYSTEGLLLIVYPNGYCYSRQATTSGGTMSYNTTFVTAQGEPSDQSEEDLDFISGSSLAYALDGVYPSLANPDNSKTLLIVFILLGAWMLISPRSAWKIGNSRKFRGAEPSMTALVVYRTIGGALIVIAIILFLI